jgi:hypothetical protein
VSMNTSGQPAPSSSRTAGFPSSTTAPVRPPHRPPPTQPNDKLAQQGLSGARKYVKGTRPKVVSQSSQSNDSK